MKVILDKVAINPLSDENVNTLGVYLGESKNEVYKKGEVVAVGEDCENIEVGDVAYYNKNRVAELKINGKIFDVVDKMAIFALD